ncbi:MAG: DUF1018 domain-containing protein [Helicobacteraceae bacterium]|jgi:hypothetical protein|nr:DUF1018 domain-containing protein [Helicobacteraceae bacterium]
MKTPELTSKQLQYRRDLLAKIHVSAEYKKKKEADAWDAFLYVNYEVETCADLGIGELKNLLDYLSGKTNEIVKDEDNRYYTCPTSEFYAPDPTDPKVKEEAEQKDGDAKAEPPVKTPLANAARAATAAQISFINAIWQSKARDKTDFALRRFIHRITGDLPLHLFSLNRKQARNVITALKAMKQAKPVNESR